MTPTTPTSAAGDDAARIAEIEARCETATPGPWHVLGDSGHFWDRTGKRHLMGYHVPEVTSIGDGECGAMLKPDAEFVAASRDDIPFLLAALREARAEAAALREALGQAVEATGWLIGTDPTPDSDLGPGIRTDRERWRELLAEYDAVARTPDARPAGEGE